MRILKVNELNRSTYFRAANMLQQKQPKRANKIRQHGDEKGLYKNFWTPDHKMDVYIHFTLDNENEDNGNYEVYPKEVITGLTFEDYQERQDDNYYVIPFNMSNTKYPNFLLNLEIQINDGNIVVNLFDDDNKFANRRSLNTCIKYLHKLYEFHDPNRVNKVVAKINDTEVSNISPSDVSYDNFWGFLNSFGYDWDKFKKSIDMSSLWDTY